MSPDYHPVTVHIKKQLLGHGMSEHSTNVPIRKHKAGNEYVKCFYGYAANWS